ncbi:MAG: hypothetical protein H7067_01525 [Burkholderiales bacterium]|nr:hypothetical protein [Opitutaceae bacterium]
MRRLALAATFVLAFSTSAHALLVQGYEADVNERFASGFASAPVANTDPNFLLAGYDLSGVGWRDNSTQFAVTLISPKHFLTAAHVAPVVDLLLPPTVSFLGKDGGVRSYAVESVSTLQYNGQNTDLALGRLGKAVDTDFITFYGGLFLGNTAADYQDLPVTLYGANGQVGSNTIDGVGNFDLLPFGGGNGTVDTVVSLTDYDPVTGEAQVQDGESGSPTFVRIAGNQLALFGIHSAVATGGGVQFTLDSLPFFSAYSQINNTLIADGYNNGWGVYVSGVISPSTIPEPASAATFLGAAALALGGLRRQRTPTRSA